MVIEDYQAHIEKENPTSEEEEVKERSLTDILKDPEQSHLFADMITTEDPASASELMGRLASKKLNDGDIEILNEKRKSFNEKMRTAETLGASFTTASLKEFAEGNKDLQKMIDNVGAENTVRIIQQQLHGLIINDPTRFTGIVDGLQSIDAFKEGEYKKADEKIKEFGAEYGISEKAYAEALTITDETKRKEKMRELVRRKYTDLGKIVDHVRGGKGEEGSNKSATLLSSKRADVEAAISGLKSKKQAVGDLLNMAFNENEDVKAALIAELAGGKESEGSELGFKALQTKLPKTEDLNKSWAEFKKKNDEVEGETAWEDMDDSPKEALREKFLQGFVNKKTGGMPQGGWFGVLTVLTKLFIEKNRTALE